MSLWACGGHSKTSFIREVDELVAEVKVDHDDYDEDDWEQKNEAFNELFEENYERWEDELTAEEKSHLIAQGLTFGLYQYGDRFADHMETNQETYLDMMDANADLVQELSETLADDVIPELQEIGPELEQVLKDFAEGLEERGTLDKLEDALKQFERRMEALDQEVKNTPQ